MKSRRNDEEFDEACREEADAGKKVVVSCDTNNRRVDRDYAEKLRAEFRKQTGWKVLPGTRIFDELTEFSKGYSRSRRSVVEVAAIFRLANGI